MTYVKVILVVVFLATAAFATAQDNLSPEKITELTELHQSIIGTYQIQLNGSRKQVSLKLLMVEKIVAARSAAEITFIPYGPDQRIMILPFQTIEAPGFIAVKPISHFYTDGPAY